MTGSVPDPVQPTSSRGAFVESLVADMTRRWQAGERALTEDYLTRHPDLATWPAAAVELIYEEICLRQEHGEQVDPEEVWRRFPQWEQQLRILLDCHELLEGNAAAPRFPEAGEVFGEFRLLAELGRGALGRVFLATQSALADRPVVLKLVPRVGQEHLSLARLQHTHIVPLYSVQDDPGRGLRALCMPYFGGATLARLLHALRAVPPRERRGEHLLGALRQAQLGQAVALPVMGSGCALLAQASYVQAICQLGAWLADALHYAGERGLVHLDLKPSNVLLAADGQPMLLDFHLARSPLQAGAAAPDWLGGTPMYMAPEQRLALDAVRQGQPVPETVDGRADIYGLGVLLCEALGGTLPSSSHAALELPQRNPEVTPGLARLLHRCLAANAEERYPDAAALADDLRRHLADLPLCGVSERPRERWQKWRRRRPRALAVSALIVAMLLVGGVAWAYVGDHASKARRAHQAGRQHVADNQYALAVSELEQSLALVEDLPFQGGLAREVRADLQLARRGRAAEKLHALVERLRELYGADLLPASQVRELEAHCRALWEKRDLIIDRLEASAELEPQLQTDMLDLAILWTDLRVRLAGLGNAAAHREALEVLGQAEAMFGPSCVLYRVRRTHAAALGLGDLARTAESAAAGLTPRTAWEHHALGLAFFRAGALTDAAAEFDRALDLQPQGLWANFYRGRCALQRGRPQDAVIAFTACVTLAPDRALFTYHRGLAYAGLHQSDQALRDYDRALRLEPSLVAAILSRATLSYQQKRYTDAVVDLLRAREHGASPAVVHYNLALVRQAQGDRAAALIDLRQVLQHEPTHRQALSLKERLLENQ